MPQEVTSWISSRCRNCNAIMISIRKNVKLDEQNKLHISLNFVLVVKMSFKKAFGSWPPHKCIVQKRYFWVHLHETDWKCRSEPVDSCPQVVKKLGTNSWITRSGLLAGLILDFDQKTNNLITGPTETLFMQVVKMTLRRERESGRKKSLHFGAVSLPPPPPHPTEVAVRSVSFFVSSDKKRNSCSEKSFCYRKY